MVAVSPRPMSWAEPGSRRGPFSLLDPPVLSPKISSIDYCSMNGTLVSAFSPCVCSFRDSGSGIRHNDEEKKAQHLKTKTAAVKLRLIDRLPCSPPISTSLSGFLVERGDLFVLQRAMFIVHSSTHPLSTLSRHLGPRLTTKSHVFQNVCRVGMMDLHDSL